MIISLPKDIIKQKELSLTNDNVKQYEILNSDNFANSVDHLKVEVYLLFRVNIGVGNMEQALFASTQEDIDQWLIPVHLLMLFLGILFNIGCKVHEMLRKKSPPAHIGGKMSAIFHPCICPCDSCPFGWKCCSRMTSGRYLNLPEDSKLFPLIHAM